MDGSGTLEKYLNFKIDWIIDFTKEMLPKSSLKKIDFYHFKKTLYEYYANVFLNKSITVENKDLLIASLKKNNINNVKLQNLYIYLFKEDLILSWNNDLTEEQNSMKSLCEELVTTIYLAMQLGKHIDPSNDQKIAYKKAIKQVLNKEKFDSYLLETLKEKNLKISKMFEDKINNNVKFVKKYNVNTNFIIKRDKILALDNSNTNMYLSKFSYTIKELGKENKKEVLKFAKKNTIKFSKIEIELVAFNVFKELFSRKNKIIFIDLPEDFLSKTNCSFIEKTISLVKSNIVFNISYDQLLKYNFEVKELQEKGYNFASLKTETDINFKKMYDIKYCFLKLEDSIAFSKTLNELKLGKITPILTEVGDITNIPTNYYMK